MTAKKPSNKAPNKSPSKSKDSKDAKVTRIKATDDKPGAINRTPKKDNKLASQGESIELKQEKALGKKPSNSKNPLKPILGYFKGAWHELKQVRWPSRRSTWGLSFALLMFTGFFTGLILLLDTIFQRLFELIV